MPKFEFVKEGDSILLFTVYENGGKVYHGKMREEEFLQMKKMFYKEFMDEISKLNIYGT